MTGTRTKKPKKETVHFGVNISKDMHERLLSASRMGVYKISLSSIIERGITLAVQEIEGARTPTAKGGE